MNKFVNATMMAVALYAAATPVFADEIISESRAVDGRTVKVYLDGVIDLKLKQGPASLVVYGDKRYVQKITVTQKGETLRIGTDLHGIHLSQPNLRAELTLPNLAELVSAGVGSADISGFKGDKVKLVLEGAGSVNMASQFRSVDANLNGAGSMNVNAMTADAVDLNLRGAGQIIVSGQSKTLRARLGGVGSLDAQQLRSDSVDVDMTGLGGATVYAKSDVKLRLTGLGSATVYGNPATRSTSSRGLGRVAFN